MDSGQPTTDTTSTTPKRAPGGGAHRRVLLTNAYGPCELKWGQSPADLLGARLARGHEMFERSAHLPTWGLYLIAENLSNPCTVLEFPTWEEFVTEVKKDYDFIAFQVKAIHMERIAKMVKAIRELAPRTQIVLGGYGVATIFEGVPNDPEGIGPYLQKNVDHFCRTEGVRYMRELLGDLPVDRPMTQFHVPPATVHPYGMSRIEIPLPAILVSLGCPSACDFCNTSAFFHHKKICISNAQQIYETMKHHSRKLGRKELTFILFDEDIFLNPELVRELGRLIRSDRETWGFRWISFGSVKALSQFTGHELRECGLEGVWIGVESGLVDHGKATGGYAKRSAELSPPELFKDLREHGIMTIGSMIIGFDFHTNQNIESDIDYFLSLRPTFYQIGPLRPCPGTKMYKTMRKEERIKKNYTWNDFHLWEVGSHEVAHMKDDEVRSAFDLAHEKQRTVLGSPVLSIFECNVLAYTTLSGYDSEFLRHHAKLSREHVQNLYPVVVALLRNAPSEQVAARARTLLAQADVVLDGSPLVARAYRAIAGEVVSRHMKFHAERMRKNRTDAAWSPDSRLTRYNIRGLRAPRIDKRSAHDVQGSLSQRLVRNFVKMPV